MDRERYMSWLVKLKDAWEKREPEKAANLFSKDVEYYESALEKPCDSWDDVLELWKKVPLNQKDVIFNFNILMFDDRRCVVNWNVNRTLLSDNKRQLINGIFLISLDSEGLCKHFNQWRTVGEG